MTEKNIRGFQVIKAYEKAAINLPQRSTYLSAGYDIEAAETMVLPSFWKGIFTYMLKSLHQWRGNEENLGEQTVQEDLLKAYLVPTGLKAYMQEDEYLQIINRSSNPLKKFLNLPNGVGIIDADYFDNPNNEGHIYVQLINYGLKDLKIEKGDRIAQGIFSKYLKVDHDHGGSGQRTGGFGSSDASDSQGAEHG